jgi:hypothetical protein
VPSIRPWDQLNGQTLAGKAHDAKLNELTVSEGTELTSSMVDSTALAIAKQQGSVLTELTDKMLYTGSKGLSKCRISPRHLQSLPHLKFCFSSYSMEHDITP